MSLAIGLIGLQLALEDRIVPGVSIAEGDIGGMTRAEAVSALSAQYGDAQAAVYTFRDGERSWTATAAELGLSLPAAELVERAFGIGHAADGRRSLREQAEAWFKRREPATDICIRRKRGRRTSWRGWRKRDRPRTPGCRAQP